MLGHCLQVSLCRSVHDFEGDLANGYLLGNLLACYGAFIGTGVTLHYIRGPAVVSSHFFSGVFDNMFVLIPFCFV